MSTGENIKGFAVGLSMTGFAILSSTLNQAPQSACVGSCQSCYACGLTVVPLVFWIAAKVRQRRPGNTPMGSTNPKVGQHLAANDLEAQGDAK
jgi:hypothetical protein